MIFKLVLSATLLLATSLYANSEHYIAAHLVHKIIDSGIPSNAPDDTDRLVRFDQIKRVYIGQYLPKNERRLVTVEYKSQDGVSDCSQSQWYIGKKEVESQTDTIICSYMSEQ